ncbi:kynurenine formamidase [Mycolicibacterium sp. BK556]|uniref:cyclase family protein n=1 Tax=Mycobacteriaceae TaxID=1762 RepID=UPI00106005CF|nr:cyclase family protein [Mycobacterium sp. BK086]MBB3602864.1 kynurenine formamidase [Mycolicibacterium sp. BK556]MBB3633059.1 kynurenine formamidase [Mycolicibacterium sp. BK607]TDO07034.1 kynurenine formamidase [Mycobacterium sp. BK086]
MTANFKDLGAELSNWGRWGPEDQLGTLNLVGPQHVRAAAAEVASGKVFQLSIAVGKDGPQSGMGGRLNPVHLMSMQPQDWDPHGLQVSDDWIIMPLQSGTQWDGLSHIGYDGKLYNGYSADDVTTRFGARKLAVDAMTDRITGRGVLLDIARLHGVDWLESGTPITPGDLEAAEAAQGVTVGEADFLLVRTGWRTRFLAHGRDGWMSGEPGLNLDCAGWLHRRGVAAVGSDNWGIEVMPSGIDGAIMPLHCVLIRDMGMPLAEILDLESLAEDCAADGRWSFLFVAPPLHISNAVGSPTTPIAIK